jgi:hypothetical protein
VKTAASVADEERAQERPHVGVRLRGVDVTAPDPAAASSSVELEESEWLWVVDDDHVVALVEAASVVGRLREVALLVAGRQACR